MLLLVTLTVRRDELEAFRAFELDAARVMAAHGGRIERALLDDDGGPTVRELHLVRFPDAAALSAYRDDPRTQAMAPQRARVVVATEVRPVVDGPGYAPT